MLGSCSWGIMPKTRCTGKMCGHQRYIHSTRVLYRRWKRTVLIAISDTRNFLKTAGHTWECVILCTCYAMKNLRCLQMLIPNIPNYILTLCRTM